MAARHSDSGGGGKKVLAAVLVAGALIGIGYNIYARQTTPNPLGASASTMREFQCSACGATFQMTVAEFDEKLKSVDPETRMLTCPQCGEAKAWRKANVSGMGSLTPSADQIQNAVGANDSSLDNAAPTGSVGRILKE